MKLAVVFLTITPCAVTAEAERQARQAIRRARRERPEARIIVTAVLVAIAAGLDQVVEQSRYERLCVYRPLVPVGRADVGFLPGGLDEKLDPWMSAIHDAIVALTDRTSSHDARRLIEELTARGQLSL